MRRHDDPRTVDAAHLESSVPGEAVQRPENPQRIADRAKRQAILPRSGQKTQRSRRAAASQHGSPEAGGGPDEGGSAERRPREAPGDPGA
jgi:hypothetical protein